MIKLKPIIKSLLITMIIGFLIGLFSTSSITKEQLKNEFITISSKSKLILFINSFCYEYWIFFLIWILGLISLGFIITYFITFYKSYFSGVLLGIIIKSIAINEFKSYLFLYLITFVFITPLLLYTSYQSITNSYHNNLTSYQSSSYLKVLFLMTLILIIYAFIKTLV